MHEKPRENAVLPRILSKSGSLVGGSVPDKMIVIARADEDVSWLSLLLPDVPHTVYQVRTS